jgi:hypothetical protein
VIEVFYFSKTENEEKHLYILSHACVCVCVCLSVRSIGLFVTVLLCFMCINLEEVVLFTLVVIFEKHY